MPVLLAKPVIPMQADSQEKKPSCLLAAITRESATICRPRCRHAEQGRSVRQVHVKHHLNDEGPQLDSSHDVAPGCVHLPEGAAFLGDLLHDLLRAEDGL